jgi:N-acetylmuramic acid 6-phosphate etherase
VTRFAELPTEAALPAARDLDALPILAVVRLLVREERRSVAAVAAASAAVAAVAEAAAAALANGGRLIYLGAGTSGRLAALDAAECGPTFGARPGQVVAVAAGGRAALARAVEGAEDRGRDATRALARLRVGARDVVVGVTASGVTRFVLAGLAAARRAGATTALVTCGRARVAVDHVVELSVGAEVVAGSTRLKAGTATKLVLNAISTAAFVRAGACWGGRMVDVVPQNAKLRARARRLVADITGQPPARAAALLRAAGGRVKVAAVMGRLGTGRADAERRLDAAGGRLRAVIGPP